VPFVDHAMQHINDESCPFFNVGTQKPLWQGKEMCISSVGCGKVHPLLEPPSWQPSHKIKQLEKSNIFKWDW
jgi:hypothetical protein